MNKIVSNLLQAKDNPHVFWPLLLAVIFRVGLQVVFALINIWSPGHAAQIAQTQALIEPYDKDIIQFLTFYGTLAAAKSGPDKPQNPNP